MDTPNVWEMNDPKIYNFFAVEQASCAFSSPAIVQQCTSANVAPCGLLVRNLDLFRWAVTLKGHTEDAACSR